MPGRLLTISETRDRLRLSRPSVYVLLKSGELPSLKFGRRRFIREEDLEQLIARRVGGGL
jgi:excisionase family DNA binding protein